MQNSSESPMDVRANKGIKSVGGGWAVRMVEVVWLACMVRLVRVFWVVRLVRLAR